MVASQNAVALIPIFSSNVPGHQRIFGEGRSQTVVLFCCIPIANLIYRCRCMCVLFGILLLILTKIFFAKFVQCSSQKVGLVLQKTRLVLRFLSFGDTSVQAADICFDVCNHFVN